MPHSPDRDSCSILSASSRLRFSMLLDMWFIFAAGQTVLLAVVLVAVLLWRGRATRAALVTMESRCNAAQAALEDGRKQLETRGATRSWIEELTARLQALDAQSASM